MASNPLTRIGPENGGDFEYRWSGDFLKVHLLSDVGKKRAGNEDCCVICAPDDPDEQKGRGILIAVADGMGGVNGGAFASRLALQTISEVYRASRASSTPARLHEALIEANRRIHEEAEHQPELQGMGTTVSGMLILGDHAYVAQVGDSRVYLYREADGLWQVTEDHSLVAEQVRNGFLSEEQARTHSLRNLITRAVGTKDTINVDLFSMQLKLGDRLVLCSDGLTGVVQDDELETALEVKNLQGAARQMVGRALEGGGPDNITVALVEVSKTPPKTRLEPGAKEFRPHRGLLSRLRSLLA